MKRLLNRMGMAERSRAEGRVSHRKRARVGVASRELRKTVRHLNVAGRARDGDLVRHSHLGDSLARSRGEVH